MAGEVIQPVRNEHVLVDGKWGIAPLGEHARKVIVGVGCIGEMGAERALAFLSGDFIARIGSVENLAFELQPAHTSDLRSYLESQIPVRFLGIYPFDESYFRVEVRAGLTPLDDSVQPI